MKPEYREGREATENFEKGMKVLFQVQKSAVLPKKAKVKKQGTTLRKTKRAVRRRPNMNHADFCVMPSVR